ncbi:hypothetical protein G7085_14325 [Tessaracoccus sp. HDW20]|nr:hypothetical protein [Tessaracoccus coleopterorum]
MFRTIDKVIEVGQDPRRFAEDLLRRLRDLVILAAVPEAATNGILDVAADQAQRLQTQVAGMGTGELTRAAEVIATGLTEMRGTTAPRLHLELMCSRVLLPGADAHERGLHARMDRLERRVGMMGEAPAAPATDWTDVAPTTVAPVAPTRTQTPRPVPAEPTHPVPARPAGPARPGRARATSRPHAQPRPTPVPAPEPTQAPQQTQPPADASPRQRPAGAPPAGTATPDQQTAPTAEARPARQAATGQLTATELRRVWPNVLEEVKRRRRFTHMLLSQHAQVIDVADGALTLGFSGSGPRENFGAGGSVDVLVDALIEVIGVELRINPVVSGPPPSSHTQSSVPQVRRWCPSSGPRPPQRPRRRPTAGGGGGGLHRRRGA